MANIISSIAGSNEWVAATQQDVGDLNSRVQALQGQQAIAQNSGEIEASSEPDATIDSFYQAMLAQNPASSKSVYQYLYKLKIQGKPLSFLQQGHFLRGCCDLLQQSGQANSALYQTMQKSILVNGMLKAYAVDLVTDDKWKINW